MLLRMVIEIHQWAVKPIVVYPNQINLIEAEIDGDRYGKLGNRPYIRHLGQIDGRIHSAAPWNIIYPMNYPVFEQLISFDKLSVADMKKHLSVKCPDLHLPEPFNKTILCIVMTMTGQQGRRYVVAGTYIRNILMNKGIAHAYHELIFQLFDILQFH